MYIFNDDTQNYTFSRLQFVVEALKPQLNEPTNQNSMRVPKFVKPTNKKIFLKNFGE